MARFSKQIQRMALMQDLARKGKNPNHPAHVATSDMNKTEAAYATLLELRRRDGEIESFGFETAKLKIGHRCTYTPDFVVTFKDNRKEMHEVKGFWRDDARVKIKVAATMFPQYRFIAVTKSRRGAWNYETIPPAEPEEISKDEKP